MFKQFKTDWMSNIRGDLLSGVVVALIPEAIAFYIISGVDPKVGLYASFSICVIVAFTGARAGDTYPCGTTPRVDPCKLACLCHDWTRVSCSFYIE